MYYRRLHDIPEQMGIKSLSKLVDIIFYTAHVRGLGAGCRCDEGTILKQLPEIT
jgi:hypothetical protein